MTTPDAQTNRLLDLIDRFAHLKVLVIGEAILDSYLQGAVTRLCREAPVPIVDVDQRQYAPGGAANTAANVARLGGETYFLSVIGCDYEGDRLREALAERDVRLDDLLSHPHRRTLVKQRVMASSHLLVRFDQGSIDAIDSEVENLLIQRLVQRFPTCDAVVISDYAYGIFTPRVIETLKQLQAEHSRVIVADSKRLQAYAEVGVTAVKPNYDETVQLLGLPKLNGHSRVEQISRYGQSVLKVAGTQMAALTIDEDGAVVFVGDRPPSRTFAKPAPGSHATGAGDTYVATLALALGAGADPHAAASLAAIATAVIVQEEGTTCCNPLALRRALFDQNKRIFNHTELVSLVNQHRALGKRVVFTNGCFDILHSGHVTCLEQAKALGDVLIVGVNSDESVRQLKGPTRPVNNLADRLTVLAALGCVDYVVPFSDRTPRELIRIIRPDVYAKGGDYTRDTLPETPLIEELGGEVRILPYLDNRSTTNLIQQIRTGYAE
ncbi:MAG: D-glycero-beta-D-manno-heptose 1-phosphate adenylyltransferase [Cyanobacteria bacterium Co-bin13]|nr:D-glycero-beta-D-manno-heptose 1-phosphate adenylyltransferase [Cyanobacteria bacterium Co-bin13]